VTRRRVVSGVGAAASLAGSLAGSVASIAVLVWATQWVLMDSARQTSFDIWVGRAAACGAWLAVLWLAVGFSVAVVAACGPAGDFWDRLAMRIAPAGVRRAAHLAAGTVLMSGILAATTVPAVARSLSPPTPSVSELPNLDRPFLPGTAAGTRAGSAASGGATRGLEPLPGSPATGAEPSETIAGSPEPNVPTTEGTATTLPTRGCSGRTAAPTRPSAATGMSTTTEPSSEPGSRQSQLPAAHPASSEDHPKPRVITVAAGDTLWDIASGQLGPDASTTDIAAEWPRWFVANRQVIGDDPDLIHPGERLVPP
jgi:resuscitation-promoting factor RpfA